MGVPAVEHDRAPLTAPLLLQGGGRPGGPEPGRTAPTAQDPPGGSR